LIKEHKANPDSFTIRDIREEVDTFMFEGHDTTAFAIFWTCHAISQHPEVQKSLHAEIDSLSGNTYVKAGFGGLLASH
jgi:cytochrome P450